MGQLEAERIAQMGEVDTMLQQINEQMEFLKVVANELEAKKSELASTSQACVQYLRREMTQAQREHKEKLARHIAEKKEIFRGYIEKSENLC